MELDPISSMAVATAGITYLTNVIKRCFPKFGSREVASLLCLIAGIAYATLVSLDMQEWIKTISTFSVLAFTFATGLYKLQK